MTLSLYRPAKALLPACWRFSKILQGRLGLLGEIMLEVPIILKTPRVLVSRTKMNIIFKSSYMY